MEQVVIVGAGPCGLSAAAELQDRGFDPLIIEKENIVHSITCYPTNMQFFSTSVLLEIAGVPFTTVAEKPTRLEALHYYRMVSERRALRIRRYEKVTGVERKGDGFVVASVGRSGNAVETAARAVVIATGYFDHPNRIGIPGEDLPHVTHFFREAHPYAGTRVTIIGGSNSAVDAALELERVGAKVTVVYRGESVSANIKPWVRPVFDGKVAKGLIELKLMSRVVEIGSDWVKIETASEEASSEVVQADFVLALTGFRPDRGFLRAMGIEAPDGIIPPTHDPETMETNVPGLYLAGVVSTGRDANEIFIESGRFHGRKIAAHLAERLGAASD
ncbi:YpdA family putative bacillithiol disulfide reductase [Cohnella thailandensis]|uniref:YpdA family putative bacillithiol disulfide reductase n=1 Tax=Cohnella thailandensis TaxID=557557 RepID=A0A841T5X9_9BACL|nr:YpdA family putative bacillithiol disulfide reductase [Cohnella thailandensis]MBB6638095.1 YpdA family putative bacillithiol disulfide reductase [Cohnella thailandensis]MBP1971979.1 thioredoxin reductase (NADPH) [Cohnella thailandensis]